VRRIRLEGDVISGWVAHEQGRVNAVIELLSNAAEEELAAGKLSVEPGHTLYAVEQPGELWLEQHRPREALEAAAYGRSSFHALPKHDSRDSLNDHCEIRPETPASDAQGSTAARPVVDFA